ncbi:uncharacterized protein [Choristoneura fumiferana]|uniref:uncharacterized protein n=1 Tax=Choristoneura fumiferana TaxID=7141 RepID=UPI003D15C8F8
MDQLADIMRQQSEMLRLMQQQIATMASSAASPFSAAVNVPWPAPLNTNIDPEEAFHLFKNGWENYIRAAQIDKWPADQEPRKLSVLMTAIGTDALKKYNNFLEKPTSCEQLLLEIKTKLVPAKNIIYNRFLFNSRSQNQGEGFESFFSAVVTLIEECDYKEKDEMLRDRIVMGILDTNLKKEMLKKEKLTLTQAVNMCKAAEAMEIQIKNMTDQKSVTEGTSTQIQKVEAKMKCKFCGNFHVFKKGVCPAWGKNCSNCDGRNHTAKVCKKKKIQEISQDCNSDPVIKKLINDKNKNLAECSLKYLNNNKWYDVNCLLDTAADDCLVGIKNLEQMFGVGYVKNKIRPSNKRLYSFGGHNIDIFGEVDITFKIIIPNKPIKKYNVTFQVVHTEHIPLLSCKACTFMGLVQFCKTVKYESDDTTEIIKKYDAVFNGLGRFAGDIDLEIDKKVSPVIQKARRIPVAFREPLKKELNRLEKLGIIEKEDNHTDWLCGSGSSRVSRGTSSGICIQDPYSSRMQIRSD